MPPPPDRALGGYDPRAGLRAPDPGRGPLIPVPSLLRGFSAPVILEYDYSDAALTHLLAHDSDAFNRWEAGQRLYLRLLTDLARTYTESGGSGRDVLLMQKLLPVLKQVSSTIGEIKVDRLTVIGQDGNNASGGGSLAGQLVAANEQVKAAVGVDLGEALRSKLGQPSTPRAAGTSRQIPAAPPPLSERPRANTPPQNFGSVTRRTPG